MPRRLRLALKFLSPGQPERKTTGIDAGGWLRRMTATETVAVVHPVSAKARAGVFHPEYPWYRVCQPTESVLGLGRGRIFFVNVPLITNAHTIFDKGKLSAVEE